MQIEIFNPSDFDEVAKLFAYCTLSPERELREYMQNDLARITVAKKDGKILGFCCLLCIGNYGDIVDIAVHKDYRRCGLASARLQEAVGFCEQSKIEDLFLEVRESNAPAIRLYEKFKFEHIATRKKYYKQPEEDGLVLRREIVL